jgi:hypothetical protein
MKKRTFLILLALLCSTPSYSADGLSLQTLNFRFEYTEPDATAAKYLADRAEEIRRQIVYLVGFDFKAQTTVRIEPDQETYRRTHERTILPEWSAGAAFPKENLIVLLSPRGSKKRIDPLPVFKHELCHIILGRALPGREAPRWLDEGIAKFQSEPWNRGKTFRMTVATLSGEAIPLSHLVNSWPADERRARIAYLESQAFVDYLFRQAAVRQVVEALAGGATVSSALSRSTGFAMPDLDKEFDRFLRRNYTWANIFLQPDFFWGMAALLFIVAALVTYFRSRKKLALMELEDEMEDLNEMRRSGLPRRERTKMMIEKRRKRDKEHLDDEYDA